MIDLEFESGEDSLRALHFTAIERMSWPFDISVTAISENTELDLETLVGKGAALSVHGVVPRAWSGIVSHAALAHAEDSSHGRSTYVMKIVPTLWLLGQRRGHRIYQHQTIPEIVAKIFQEWSLEFDIRGVDAQNHPKLEYCVQYGETDLVFVSRLLERAGIAFWFDERIEGGKALSEIRLSDHAHENPLGKSVPFVDNPNEAAQREFITNVALAHRVAPGQMTIRDFDFRRPDFAIVGKTGPAAPAPQDQNETYLYRPGSSLVDVDSPQAPMPVGDDKSSARHDDAKYAVGRATVAHQAQRTHGRAVHYRTNVLDLHPGQVFVIQKHPHTELDIKNKLLVVACRTDGTAVGQWQMSGEAVFAEVPYSPPQVMPAPKVPGLQTAMVVGPKGQEIYTDEFGRVRVKMHWDREGVYDDNATCWLRVSQHWAGAGWGTHHIPRVGHEVIVDFQDGDPDQPIVIGRLFNATAKPPYVLPKGKTQSTWKSDSYPHKSNAFNEIMFEDKAGGELFFMQAQRDMRKLVKRNDTERVGNDRTHVIGAARLSVIAGHDTGQVSTHRLVQIAKMSNLNILRMGEPDYSEKPTFYQVENEKITLSTSGASITLDGPKIMVEAKAGIQLSAAGKIIIQGGPAVYLNEKPGGVTQPEAEQEVEDAVPRPRGRILNSILKLFARQRKAKELAHKEQQIKVILQRPPVESAVKPAERPGRAAALLAKYDTTPQIDTGQPILFGQSNVSPRFSSDGKFKGADIDEVVQMLKDGKLSAKDFPVKYIWVDGKKMVVNNRSLTTLSKAGLKPTEFRDATGTLPTDPKDPDHLVNVLDRLESMPNNEPSEVMPIRTKHKPWDSPPREYIPIPE